MLKRFVIPYEHSAFALLLLILACARESPTGSENEPQITFDYEFIELTRYTSGYCYWDMRITNTSSKTTTYWRMTLDVFTAKPSKYRAYMYDEDLWLEAGSSYLAESVAVRETSNCTAQFSLCGIYIPYGEEITKWEVVSTYAEGE